MNMSKAINYSEFRGFLKANNLSEACQYYDSLYDALILYMPISLGLAKEMANIIIKNEELFKDNMNNVIQEQINNGSVMPSYQPKKSDIPQNMCAFGELNLPANLMLKKSIYDFFHWSKICLELPLQIINAIMDSTNRVEESKVTMAQIKKQMEKDSRLAPLLVILKRMEDDVEFKYIRAFDNSAKHIRLVSTEVPTIQFGIGKEPPLRFSIGEFSHRDFSSGRVDALIKIDECAAFVSEITYLILLEIQRMISSEIL